MQKRSLESLFSLEGRTAVITGGAGVLCGAIAESLLAAGAAVCLLDKNEEMAHARAHDLKEAYPEGVVLACPCDILDRAELEGTRTAILEQLGRIDILVNGAGGNAPDATTDPGDRESFFKLPAEGFRRVFDLNFFGTVLCCQVFGRTMADHGKGSVINIASLSGLTPLSRIPAYSAAKAAVLNFTQWLAVDLAQHGAAAVRVNSIVPGFFHTRQNHFLLYKEEDRSQGLTARGEAILVATPQARFGQGSDLAGAAVWLASDSAAFVTGTAVVVDGGFNAYSGV